MSDYTPTTDQIRDAYARAMRNAFIASTAEHVEEFDRWLQSNNEKIWDEGFDFGYDRVLVERAATEYLTDFRANPYAKANDEGTTNV